MRHCPGSPSGAAPSWPPGITAIVCAVVMGQPQLTRVGVLVAALPLLTAAVIGRSRYRLALVRTVNPQLVDGRPAGPGDAGADQRGPDAERRAACWRTRCPTCSAPGPGSCWRASATAGGAT